MIVSALEDTAWDTFVAGHPGGCFQYSSGYRRLLHELLGCSDGSIAVMVDGRVAGVMPLLGLNGQYGPVWNSQPYHGSLGGILSDSAEATIMLSETYSSFMLDAASATVVDNPFVEQDHGLLPYNALIEQTSHVTELGDDPDRLFERFEKRCRWSIRKAERAGVTIHEAPAALGWLEATHRANMQAVGVEPKPPEFFRLVRDLFEPGSDFHLYVAHHNKRMVAAALVFRFDGVIDYYLPALDHDARHTQALSLLLYQAMYKATTDGVRAWNWGASSDDQQGVRLFKRQWATTDRPLYYRNVVNNLSLYDVEPSTLRTSYPGFFVRPFER
jgi:hypothetical protein